MTKLGPFDLPAPAKDENVAKVSLGPPAQGTAFEPSCNSLAENDMESTNLSKLTDRELDALAVVEVMGWEGPIQWDSPTDAYQWLEEGGVRKGSMSVPRYSTDGNAMLEVLEKMGEDGWEHLTGTDYGHFCFWRPVVGRLGTESYIAPVVTPSRLPRAVTEAALEAVRATEAERP